MTSANAPRRRPSPLDAGQAGVYEQSLMLVRHMRDLFPAFYATHIAARTITPHTLYAAVRAFLALVNRDLFELEDCMAFDVPLDPVRALRVDDTRDDPLLLLEEGCAWFAQPQPVMYGIGIEGILEDETPQCILTLALWRLCQNTDWSIGVDVADVIGFSLVSDEVAERIQELRPLPAGVAMAEICVSVTLPGGPWSLHLDELIRYAFARTHNPMANITNYEIEVVYGGDVSDTWDDARGIAENAAAARKLVGLYGEWAATVDRDPWGELRALSRALHKAAKPQTKRQRARRALVDILLPEPETEALDLTELNGVWP